MLNPSITTIAKPTRWAEPFDTAMTTDIAALVRQHEPFASMDPAAFSTNVSLDGILRNDCRLIDLQTGDIIVREGDYGSSAFLILTGEAVVSLNSLPASVLGRRPPEAMGWGKAIAQLWKRSPGRESRDYSENPADESVLGTRQDDQGTHIFLHDIPRVIPADRSVTLSQGEIFGEMSALTRTPRSATVVAGSEMQVLEIRWQGFRELLKRHTALRQHVDRLYRENSLAAHLREVGIFKSLPAETIAELAKQTTFANFGEFRWNRTFESSQQDDVAQQILAEPVITTQGDYADGLTLIRNGFARLSRQHGSGFQTIAYLGKGETFGFRELAHNWRTGQQRSWSLGLRAVGYVDVLKIPTAAIEQLVLPQLAASELPPPLPELDAGIGNGNRRMSQRDETLDSGLLEFLVGGRHINGTQAMVIDLDRCTRCDDCVRACAATHDDNPRFIRQGPKHDHWMIANACMHCVDPVCMIGCPTGAIGRDTVSGTITINDRTCVGCSTCANSCPYHNIRMVEISDAKGRPLRDQDSGLPIVKATKCDLCLDQPAGPACQRACPHDALVRVDLTTPLEMLNLENRT